MPPLSPHDTDSQTERQADTYSKHPGHSHQQVPPNEEVAEEHQARIWCKNTNENPIYIDSVCVSFGYCAIILMLMKEKNIHKSFKVFSSSDLQMAQDNKWCQWNPWLSPRFLIWMGQKCANKWPVVAGDQTLSLWGRPNDFYLLLCKHIKAISDCGGSSVFDHAAAVLAEAWLVSLGSSFCSLCKQKEALRKSSWLIPFASIPLLKAVRRLPGKPNMTAKTKHDSARRRMRHSWGIEQGTTF